LARLDKNSTDNVTVFLTRDAMLAQYMLSSCIRPSFCHKSEFYKDR